MSDHPYYRLPDRSPSRSSRPESLIHPDFEDEVVVDEEPELVHLESEQAISPTRTHLIRALALLCACSLSVGSHYASYILGPLKSRLSREMGTNNTEFSLLLSAFSLNSTWTPLVGGVMASRLGTTFTSILATGVVFLGQLCLLVGHLSGSVRLMALGMFIFGFGVSPLAVVQETIIVRFFKSHGLGVSLALGLVAGKGASFVSARTSYPLAERFGPNAPFFAATALAGMSFLVNLIYLSASKWLVRGAGAELEASDLHAEAHSHAVEHSRSGSIQSLTEAEALREVAKKRVVHYRDITKLGDVFWAYMGLNVICGMIWAPFTHLAANIIERRYHLTESDASIKASYVLAGSVILYPITGYIVDVMRKRHIVLRLFMLSSFLTLFCYIWLALPPSVTETPLPAIASFATGHGFSPLLLVVIVPEIVSSKYVSTTLGAHKALEQTGTTIFQTLAGMALDIKSKKVAAETVAPVNGDAKDIQYLLNAFLILNAVQMMALAGLTRLDRKQKRAAERRMAALLPPIIEEDDEPYLDTPPLVKTPQEDDEWHRQDQSSPALKTKSLPGTIRSLRGMPSPSTAVSAEQSIPLLRPPSQASSARNSLYLSGLTTPQGQGQSQGKIVRTKTEVKRGRIFALLSGALIAFAWLLFMGTAWLRLRSKEERGSSIRH